MTDGERMADPDRARRDREETYGRGGGDRFDERGYPQSYGTPDLGVGDWRRAMRAYVTGHDRGWSADRKHLEAGRAGDEGPGGGGASDEREPRRDAAAARGIRFGVEVPNREDFSFHRGASIWRDRLPASDRLPRHTDRELDGQRGEGDQS